MSFANLESDSDATTKDYVFRADVKDSNDGNVDQCEDQANGYGLGVDRYMNQVDGDPETRTGTISADCPVGAYTLRVSISTPDNVELASDSTNFTVVDPGSPLSNDPTLSGLTLCGVDFGTFTSTTTAYTANVGNDVAETTVTATVNDDGATYASSSMARPTPTRPSPWPRAATSSPSRSPPRMGRRRRPTPSP